MNTNKAEGRVCEIESFGGRYRADVFYLCYTTVRGEAIKKRIGSNLSYKPGEQLSVIYKKNIPHMARLNNVSSLWIVPILYYLLPLGFLLALATGIFYSHSHVIISMRPLRIWLYKKESKSLTVQSPRR